MFNSTIIPRAHWAPAQTQQTMIDHPEMERLQHAHTHARTHVCHWVEHNAKWSDTVQNKEEILVIHTNMMQTA